MKRLFEPIDNAPLILFRIFLGFLLAMESFGAIATGWVRIVLIEPKFTFSHIGLEWLQPLPGYGMYFYYAIMGILGILVMLGYKYRWSMSAYTLLWAGVYFMQKSAYNNHYYLLLLICFIMIFLPANRYKSIDARLHPEIKKLHMPRWCSWVMILQVAIVYFFATIAKFYPGWLDGSFTKILFSQLRGFPLLGNTLFQQEWFYIFIAYAGILFDGLIIPALLWKKTRTFALVASILFHLFNSVTLEIGIFPYFALSFAVFFYEPEKIRALFFKNKPVLNSLEINPDRNISILKYLFLPFFIIQLILPIRHHFIKGDVLWTEEGHRLSWRMMLRFKNGNLNIKIIDKKTKKTYFYKLYENLTYKQISFVVTKPDGIWQLCQRIKKEYHDKGQEVQIFVESKVAVNNGEYKTLINPNTDMAQAKWDYFFHNDWILLEEPTNSEENLIQHRFRE